MKKIALLTAVLGVMFCFAGACPAAAATAAVKLPGNSGPWRADTQQPYLYEDVVLDCLGLAERYPGIIAADSLCTTFGGRQVPHLLIGDVKAAKHVLIMGAIHARGCESFEACADHGRDPRQGVYDVPAGHEADHRFS